MEEVEILRKIEKVAVPPHLYTRIQGRLTAGAELVSKNWLVFSYACVGILFLGNILLFNQLQSKTVRSNGIEMVADDLNLNPSNQFYYD